jgi:histidinol-phosphate aminotransferase
MTDSINPNAFSSTARREHGGPDAYGAPRFDFSTNTNACGPCPVALYAVQNADVGHYPDASYAAMRAELAAFHGVEPWRVVLAGSASEFIFRITAWVAQQYPAGQVSLPPHAYGDYAHAAQAWGLGLEGQPDDAKLVWACEPSSPLGGAHTGWPGWLTRSDSAGEALARMMGLTMAAHWPVVLDCAYAPLRLSGVASLSSAQLDQVWQMWTPNKALGLTGVRGAYAIAPQGAEVAVAELNALCASWPLGAHAVAMLQAWVKPKTQAWLADSRETLSIWKARQIDLLQSLGWHCVPSDANYFCAAPAQPIDLNALRDAGIKLRDATSFGLSGHVRLRVMAPEAQDALKAALVQAGSPQTGERP